MLGVILDLRRQLSFYPLRYPFRDTARPGRADVGWKRLIPLGMAVILVNAVVGMLKG